MSRRDLIRVLVIDDSAYSRQAITRMLESSPLVKVVGVARDGEEELRKAFDLEPDLITLDLEMPRMDGYEFASHVRNDDRVANVPIIMITSRVGDKHRARAIELGVNDYLGKPYQDAQLLEAIRRQFDEIGITLL